MPMRHTPAAKKKAQRIVQQNNEEQEDRETGADEVAAMSLPKGNDSVAAVLSGNGVGIENTMQQLIQLLALKIEGDERKEERVKIAADSFENVVCKFDGYSVPVKKWFDIFERNAEAYELTEKQKYVQARGKMCGAARLFLESELVSDYDELKRALCDEFENSLNSADVHQQLRDRKKRKDETFHEYMLNMKKLAVLGKVEEAAVLRYIVDGLNMKNEYKYAMYRCKSFKELKAEFDVYERLIRSEKENNGQSKTNIVASERHVQNKRKEYCFNCGSAE